MLVFLVVIAGKFCTAQELAYDAIYNYIIKEYTLSKEGSVDYHYSSSMKLLTHQAFQRYFGESFIVYNPQFQRLKVNKSRTIMADGKKVDSPLNAFNEVLPRFASGSAAYNHLREMVVSHTGLEVGATIEFDYNLVSQPTGMPYLMGEEILSFPVPVESYKVIVRVPEGTILNYKMLNLRLNPEISFAKGMMIYTWNFGKVAANPHEIYMPEDSYYSPYLSFSTSLSLQRSLELLSNQPAFTDTKLPHTAMARIDQIKASDASDSKKIIQIRNLVINELSYLKIPSSVIAFKFRTPAEVWESLSGTEIEKTILLASMLRQAGYQADIVAAVPTNVLDTKWFNPLVIDAYYVRTEIPGSASVYLSAINEHPYNLLPDLYGNTLLLLDPAAESVKKWEIYPENSTLKVKGNFEVKSASVEGNGELELTGRYHPFYRILENDKEITNILTGFCSGENISSFKSKQSNLNRLQTEISVKADQTLTQLAKGFYEMELPFARTGVTSWNVASMPSSRISPFAIPYFLIEDYDYTLQIPDTLELLTPVRNLEIRRDFGAVRIQLSKNGNMVKIRRTIEFVENEVNPMKYGELREIFIEWMDPQYRKLVFKKK